LGFDCLELVVRRGDPKRFESLCVCLALDSIEQSRVLSFDALDGAVEPCRDAVYPMCVFGGSTLRPAIAFIDRRLTGQGVFEAA
jgi:hypothetical protein